MAQSDVVCAYRARCQRALNRVRAGCTVSIKFNGYNGLMCDDEYLVTVTDVNGSIVDHWFMLETNMECYPCTKLHP